MSLLGPHPLAIVLCKPSDQPQEPQSPTFFRGLFTREDARSWAQPFWVVDPKLKLARPGAKVAVVARYPDQLDVFWVADDGAIWSNWWNAQRNSGRWNTPFPITAPNVAPPGGAVAAVARHPEHLDVFWADNAGAIGTNWWDGNIRNGDWNQHGPFRISGVNVVPPGGGVAVVARHPNHLDVFWADIGGAVSTNWWDGNIPNGDWNQHGPFRISGVNVVPPGGGVAVVARRPNHLDVFWADTGGAVGTNWWDGDLPNGGWSQHAAFRISDANVVPPGGGVAAVARRPDHLDVFWADNGGALGTNWWDGNLPSGGWNQHPAFRISSPKTVPPGARVSAAARYPFHLDVFWVDNTGAIGTNWWDANINNGQWNTPFQLSNIGVVPPGEGVVGLARFPDHLDVFWADTFRGIGTNFWPSPSPFGLAQYWSDMSYQQFDIDGTQVFGWFSMPTITQAQFAKLSRQGKIDACVAAAVANGVKISDFFTVVAISNALSDSGSSNGKTILDPGAWTLGWAAHETGHDLGLDHSFDDSPVSCSPANDGRPGAYGDGWDIMSFACYGGINPMFSPASGFGASGPGLNAPYRDKLGWIPANRILEIVAGNASHRTETLAALNHVEATGYLMVKIFADANDRSQYYTVEFRRKEGWDAGIAQDTVLVHAVKNGLSFLIRAAGGPERRPGHHLDVFWPDNGAAIGSNWWDANANNAPWNIPFRITDSNIVPRVAAVAAVSRRPNHLDVFWADNGGAVGTNWWDGNLPNGGWHQHAAFRISDANVAPPGAAVAAVARYRDQLDVFWVGNDGGIWSNWWSAGFNNGRWNTPFRISGANVAPPGGSVAAVARFPDQLDVFWANNDGAIWTNWWNVYANNREWNAAFRVSSPGVVSPGAPVAVAARHSDHLDVFWADRSGAIQTIWWDGQDPNGAWSKHPSVLITNARAVSPGAGVAAVARYPDLYTDPSNKWSLKVQRIDVRSSTATIDIAFT